MEKNNNESYNPELKEQEDKKHEPTLSENMIESNEQRSRNKYGDKLYDVIARMFQIDLHTGFAYAGGNAIKYLERFIGRGYKSKNLADLIKARDYLNRMIDKFDTASPEELAQLRMEEIKDK